MTRLSTEQILKDNNTGDPNSIKSLTLTHKALSGVSCLTDFNNLDSTLAPTTSLLLRHCVNLKWLSVVQNKLQSLKGIEGLSKLTVLNAGKNKLRSMDEVMSVVSLCALILNDNEIVSICKLDQMKELNTLVLSRNPIRKIGDSLLNMKAITKLSLSNCQVQIIGSSLKSCTELKELRLSDNDIKLAFNKKLQNLDLGKNLITRWSELKVLKSLVSLNNLNLQGNPVAEYDKLAKKVKNLLPNLRIFNARPIDRITKNEKDNIVDKVNDSSNNADDTVKVHMEKKRDGTRETNDKPSNKEIQRSKSDSAAGKKLKKKSKEKEGELDAINDAKNSGGIVDGDLSSSRDVDMEKDLKRKRKKTSENLTNKDIQVDDDDNRFKKKQKKQSKEKQGELDIIDNGEAAFAELFSANIAGNPEFDGDNMVNEASKFNSVDGLVTTSAKEKKSKNRGMGLTVQLSQEPEVGLGGPSTWGDE
ncbi:leucine-rich repeat and IQ domain-containing protein 1-related [Citrus sinensis]|uniref:Leucine-rich repeat and IQ domain-containing protein 1-related n=1 Tax=Citrus sinensis TaxID=2711 RepID=A0ACB8IRB5_CITSI|nr:leucine-rich repeat and IQ domain-containing protein 1-related [Citrus sinensis]